MTMRRTLSAALATQIFQSIAAAASIGVIAHASGCGADVEDGGGSTTSTAGAGGNGAAGGNGGAGVTSSSISASGGLAQPKQGIQCIPWPPRGDTGAGGADGTGGVGAGGPTSTAGPSVTSTGAGGEPCPNPQARNPQGMPYLDPDEFCTGYPGGCCSMYQSVGLGTLQDGECCYEVVANCTSGSGRPLFVDGRALTAEAVRGSSGDWRASPCPTVDGLTVAQREALSAAWLGDALLEHASVASFSRFAIELMAVGAPAELLDLAHAAARDEIEHARLCFALASTYAGHALEPAPMPSLGALTIATDLAEVAGRAVAEGCVGETLAALVAAEQMEAATEPAARAVLARMAEDEARHAALAWRFVAWALRAGDGGVRDAVMRAFGEAIDGIENARDGASGDACHDPALTAHGRLDGATQRAIARAAVNDVIRPGARALAATDATETTPTTSAALLEALAS